MCVTSQKLSIVTHFQPFSINIRGKLHHFGRPQIMGIVNITPDSFFSGSRTMASNDIKTRVEQMLMQGVDMFDIGAYSSRPGADDVSESEECRRLHIGLEALRQVAGNDIPVSVDTFRAKVAHEAISNMGADIINDISGGNLDSEMFATVAALKSPYILMHMRGTPATMQQLCDYSAFQNDITAGVISELSGKIATLRQMGVSDVIVDPGFGFSKTMEQNYSLMKNLHFISEAFNAPVLVGVSRKSMVCKALNLTPAEALNGTTSLHTIALMQGAAILRVHDVAEARQALAIVQHTYSSI